MNSTLKTMNIDHKSVQYAILGTGFPILLIHGSPGGWDQMMAEFSYLADHGFTVIAPSRPGYCGTPLSSGATVEDQAQLCADLMRHLGFDAYAILAWSGGGPAAICLAALDADKVKALYLQACVTKSYDYTEKDQKATEPFFNPVKALLLKWLIRYAPKMVLFETVKQAYSCSGDAARDKVKSLMQEDPAMIPYIQALAGSVIPPSKRKAGFRNDIKQFANLDQLPLAAIKAPTLIIQGSIDESPPLDNAEYAAATIKNSELIIYENMPHEPRLSEQYTKVRQTLLQFLEKVL